MANVPAAAVIHPNMRLFRSAMLLLVALILPVYTASVSASKENFVKEKVLRVDISTERKHEFRRRLLMDSDAPPPPDGADTGGTDDPPAGIGGGMPVGGDNEETGQGIDTCAAKESEDVCTSPCNWGITTDGYGGCSSTASTDACSGKPYAECTAENSGCTWNGEDEGAQSTEQPTSQAEAEAMGDEGAPAGSCVTRDSGPAQEVIVTGCTTVLTQADCIGTCSWAGNVCGESSAGDNSVSCGDCGGGTATTCETISGCSWGVYGPGGGRRLQACTSDSDCSTAGAMAGVTLTCVNNLCAMAEGSSNDGGSGGDGGDDAPSTAPDAEVPGEAAPAPNENNLECYCGGPNGGGGGGDGSGDSGAGAGAGGESTNTGTCEIPNLGYMIASGNCPIGSGLGLSPGQSCTVVVQAGYTSTGIGTFVCHANDGTLTTTSTLAITGCAANYYQVTPDGSTAATGVCEACDVYNGNGQRTAQLFGSSTVCVCSNGNTGNDCSTAGAGGTEESTGNSEPCSNTGGSSSGDCKHGEFLDFDTCKKCVAGKYTDQFQQNYCKPCDIGKFSMLGSSYCSNCWQGRYQNEQSKPDCKNCEKNFYTNTATAYECQSCDEGKYSPESAPNCVPCGQGRYRTTSDIECKACSSSKYQNEESGSCKDCAPGSWAPEGSFDCQTCGVGQYRGQQGVECIRCPIGFSQPVEGSTDCNACDVGKSSLDLGAPLCSDCARGQYRGTNDEGACINCAVGFVQPNTGSEVCETCPQGSSTNDATGAIACMTCNTGRYTPTEGAACLECKRGFFSNEHGTFGECQICDAGKMSLKGSANCIQCLPGQYRNKIISRDFWGYDQTTYVPCATCAEGQFAKDSGWTACENCNPGTSSAGGQIECTPCDSGRYQAGGGTGENLDSSACEACDAGKYSIKYKKWTIVIDSESLSATAGMTVTQIDANDPLITYTGILAVSLNEYVDTATIVVDAMVGEKFVAGKALTIEGGQQPQVIIADTNVKSSSDVWFGPTQCENCPSGYSAGTASPRCSECDAGKYNTNLLCVPCVPGTYSNQPASIVCEDCAAGSTSNSGAADCRLCDRGKYKIIEGDGICDPCLAGFYAGITGSTGCSVCEAGRSSGEAAPMCTDCVGGRYHEGSLMQHWENEWTFTVNYQSLTLDKDSPVVQTRQDGTTHEGIIKVAVAGYTMTVVVQAILGNEFVNHKDLFVNPGVAGEKRLLATDIQTVKNTDRATSADYNGECIACAIGKYSNGGTNVCIDCPDGKFFVVVESTRLNHSR